MLWLLIVAFLLQRPYFATTDAGVRIDPEGSPRTAAVCTDEGNGLDPHGKPCTQQALSIDDGRGIDPNG